MSGSSQTGVKVGSVVSLENQPHKGALECGGPAPLCYPAIRISSNGLTPFRPALLLNGFETR
jgi:hypothetical protein